jgi:predicted transcriptional regulator
MIVSNILSKTTSSSLYFDTGYEAPHPVIYDLERLHVASMRPRADLSNLLSKSDNNGFRLSKDLDINYRVCLFHLKKLEDAELIEGLVDNVAAKTYHITPKGKEIFSHTSKVL